MIGFRTALWLSACGGVVAALLAFPAGARAAPPAQAASCGAAAIEILGGRPALFVLPRDAGKTLEVEPNTVLTLRGSGVPVGTQLLYSLSGARDFAEGSRSIGAGTSTTVNVGDYARYGHGLYGLDLRLVNAGAELCATSFQLRIGGFGGRAGMAAAAAAGVAALAWLLSAMYTANGTRAKLQAKVAVQRRLPHGWRRWVPVPAWKRTIIGTVIGAVAGLCVTALLQQAGFTPLSVATAIWALALGGAIALGVGLSLGAVLTYLRPPAAPATATASPAGGSAGITRKVESRADQAAAALERVQAFPLRVGKRVLRFFFRRG